MTPRMPPVAPELVRAIESPERRLWFPGCELQWREAGQTGDGTHTIDGRPIVYEAETVLYSGRHITITERIATGAMSEVMARQPTPAVHLNHGHDMTTVMARLARIGRSASPIPAGQMEAWEDQGGVRIHARVDPEMALVRDLAVQMRSGLIDQMSFAFRIGVEDLAVEVDADREHETWRYTVREISEWYDVCVCAQGAYPTTQSELRAAAARSRRSGVEPEGEHLRRSDTEGEDPAIAPPAGGPSPTLRAKARAARVLYPRR